MSRSRRSLIPYVDEFSSTRSVMKLVPRYRLAIIAIFLLFITTGVHAQTAMPQYAAAEAGCQWRQRIRTGSVSDRGVF